MSFWGFGSIFGSGRERQKYPSEQIEAINDVLFEGDYIAQSIGQVSQQVEDSLAAIGMDIYDVGGTTGMYWDDELGEYVYTGRAHDF